MRRLLRTQLFCHRVSAAAHGELFVGSVQPVFGVAAVVSRFHWQICICVSGLVRLLEVSSLRQP